MKNPPRTARRAQRASTVALGRQKSPLVPAGTTARAPRSRKPARPPAPTAPKTAWTRRRNPRAVVRPVQGVQQYSGLCCASAEDVHTFVIRPPQPMLLTVGQAGFFCTSSTAKIACNYTFYCPEGSADQVLCPAGSVCETPDEKKTCARGTFCPAGSIEHLPCAAGNFSTNPASPCERCAAGKMQASSGQSECVDCMTAGKLCTEGSSEEASCPAGHFCPSPSTQLPCESEGAYCPGLPTLHSFPPQLFPSSPSLTLPGCCPRLRRLALHRNVSA